LDNLTHSLFALTLARTPLGRQGRGTTAALLLSSNAPDIDIVATAGGAAKYLEWHRGPTHGPLGVVGLGLLVAALVWVALRASDHQGARARASLPVLWMVSGFGVLCHVLMDVPTSYGTRALSPFSWTWMAEDWLPIVDVYLLAILGAGLLIDSAAAASVLARLRARFGTRSSRPRRLSGSSIVLAFMALNYGLHGFAHHRAMVAAPQAFGELPPPCADAAQPGALIDRWPRPSTLSPRERAATRCLVEIAALPDFVSPFRWRLVAQLSNGYDVRTIDLLTRDRRFAAGGRLMATHYPNQWTPAVQKAAAAPMARVFLGFSRFPAARSEIDADGNAVVRWTDIRFDADGTRGTRGRGANLFGAVVEVNADGTILRERFGS
jgi:membrane-bound metal-dependent hydrolase YbcI (DUF457 family)